jgi:hypothetical protein
MAGSPIPRSTCGLGVEVGGYDSLSLKHMHVTRYWSVLEQAQTSGDKRDEKLFEGYTNIVSIVDSTPPMEWQIL